MKSRNLILTLVGLLGITAALHAAPDAKTLVIQRDISEEAKSCLECHAKLSSGIVHDWRNSRHAHAGVSCMDCHKVASDNPMAAQNCEGVKGSKTFISAMVTPNTCSRCHPAEAHEFKNSGHFRARLQVESKEGMKKLMYYHQGKNHPKYETAPDSNGCAQCHGSVIELDENKRPTSKSWPNAGIGTVWPDGAVGSCIVCHTRHKFDIAEARKPEACASCHLGPDHPNYEIFMSSKHGQIFKADGANYKWDSPTGAWQPGDYRGPTCATCHMSGVGKTNSTHNVTKRLYWNSWAKESKVRNHKDPMNMLFGDGEKGRAEMKEVCSNCHSKHHTNNFFTSADDLVKLYNEAYWKPAKKMHDELKAKGLLMKNPWKDPFQKVFYHLWHHQGRRMRMGALMAGPDYAHWHGSFEVMIDLNELEEIYKKRMKTGKIEH